MAPAVFFPWRAGETLTWIVLVGNWEINRKSGRRARYVASCDWPDIHRFGRTWRLTLLRATVTTFEIGAAKIHDLLADAAQIS